MIADYKIYKDETGSRKGETQKRQIVEIETFQVEKYINIISEIIAIMEKEYLSNPVQSHTFMLKISSLFKKVLIKTVTGLYLNKYFY